MESHRIRRLLAFLLEGGFGLFLVLAPIQWMDRRGVFDIEDEPHWRARWQSLQVLKGKLPVDVLILGNSHAFTGFEPAWLSSATDMTCFVLGNSSTNAVDHYWALRQALEYTQPQLVLVETTGMNETEMVSSDGGIGLVNQLRAFHARSSWALKFESCLELFEWDDLPAAFSPSIMNHHLWWTDAHEVRKNIVRGRARTPRLNGVYLGDYARFRSGIADTTLAIYRERGGILDGAKGRVSEVNQKAVERIVQLGKERGFQVGFVTLPMHQDYLFNESDREAHLEAAIQPLGVPWLNLQQVESLTSNPGLFENTLGANQHMTERGSIAANQPIADWIGESFSNLRRPGRERDALWHQVMQVKPGYLAYHDPLTKENPAIAFEKRDVKASNRVLSSVSVFRYDGMSDQYMLVYARPEQAWFTNVSADELVIGMELILRAEDGSETAKFITLKKSDVVNDGERWLFQAAVSSAEVVDIRNCRFIHKSAL